MELTPDEMIFWEWEWVHLNATIMYTWAVMALMVVGSWLVTRNMKAGVPGTRAQSVFEVIIGNVRSQIQEITQQDPKPYLPFLGTLYLFLAVANFLAFVPGYHPPTGSLSTTGALAACVFLAVPVYSIAQQGLKPFLRHYIEPTPLMLPFHIIGEISRTIALAVRLFGNVMSGALIAGIILSIAPLFFPIVLRALELLIGQVQAYIFAVLSTVYIASAAREHEKTRERVRETHPSEPTKGE
jgi:F-type H+-transporting ATPase subunit a